MNDPTTQTVGIVLGASFISLVFIEFALSILLRKKFVSTEYLIVNLSVAFLQQLTDVVNKVVFIGAFIYIQSNYSILHLFGISVPEAANPFSPFDLFMLLNYLLVIVLADFCQYWLHRFSHEINWMWAGHVTHHSNNEYNLSVAVRQNALEGIYTWIFFIPLAFFGIPWQMFLTAYAVSLFWQFIVHTRFINRLGFLEIFMSTPSHHRVHHGKNPQYIDKNYGAFLIVWDKLFGTFEPESEVVEYGITQPLRYENPLWSNVHHHIDIIKNISHSSSLRERAKWIFGKPSLIYAAKEFQPNSGTPISSYTAKSGYVFFNFLIVAVAGFLGLNYAQQHSNILVFCATGLAVVLCFTIFTALLENRVWANHAEIIRLVLMVALGGIFLLDKSLYIWGLVLVSLSLLFMVATYFLAIQYKIKERLN